ncbi:MAG: alpha/beta hydrolase [bacterium]|nr:alpha/beta hydrolase [bacterium]
MKVFIPLIIILLIIFSYPYQDGVTDHRSLAYGDSRFISIDGLEIHYKRYGSGDRYLIMLHGFGSNTYTWEKIVKSLSKRFTILSFDRPGFGLTERRFDLDYNPYTTEYHIKLIKRLMEVMGINRATLVGHSAGATLAVLFTLDYPERVEELILISPAIYTANNTHNWVRIISNIPLMERIGQQLMAWILLASPERSIGRAYYNPDKITKEDIEAYTRPTKVFGWKRALWEIAKVNRRENIEPRLLEIRHRVTIIHGRQDRLIPLEDSVRLNSVLVNSNLFIIEDCGHIPQEECPEKVVEILHRNLGEI